MQAAHADANIRIIRIYLLPNTGITSHIRLVKLKIEAFVKLQPYPAAPSSLRPKKLDEPHFKSDWVRASAKSKLCELHAAHLKPLPECPSQLFEGDTVPLFSSHLSPGCCTMGTGVARWMCQGWMAFEVPGKRLLCLFDGECCKARRDPHEMKRPVKVSDVI